MHDWTVVVRHRLTTLSAAPVDDTLADELAAHLAQIYDEAREAGQSDDEAAAAALRILDAPDLFRSTIAARRPTAAQQVRRWSREETLPAQRGSWMTALDVTRDARHALRMILRAPGFSAIAILTFAVGIGMNTAVFNVVNGVLLRPLPYPDADRITMLWLDNRRQNISEDIGSYPAYLDWKQHSASYDYMAGYTTQNFTLVGAGEPERISGAQVTASFFPVMGLQPVIGRIFTEASETPGQDTPIVISHGLWQRRFGGAADVIGKTITLNNRPREIIGVMPASLQWPQRAELWAPLAPPQQLRESRNSFWLPVIGRLKPGIPVEQAHTEMDGIGDRLEQAYPQTKGYGINVVSLERQITGDIEQPLLILLAAVGFVLLIACANLANLMLGRTAARQKELAIRTALGAQRGVLIRQIVTEAMVLALIGATIGVALAYWATGVFVTLGGASIPRPDAIVMDARVLLFALGLAMLSAVLAGLVPALQASRHRVNEQLRDGTREGASGAGRRTRHMLVAAEVALSLVLLTGAGLLVRTLWTMQLSERGFRPERVAMMTVSAGAAYAEPADVLSFYNRLLERVRVLPGVEHVASGTGVLQPLVANSTEFTIEGQPLPPPEERVEFPFESVSPGYFETLGMTIVRGRSFTDADTPHTPRVAVINETLANLAWPGQDPIGRRLGPGDDTTPEINWRTVVGVIRDAHRSDLTRTIRPEVYFSTVQGTPRTQTLFVKTAGDPDAIVAPVRQQLRAIDPQMALFRVTTLEKELAVTLTQPRFQAVLLAAFAVIALLLAAIGIYGVTAHAVGQRTQEVGIRMAMGAERRDVLRMMVAQHLRPALAGVAIGLAGAFALSRFLQSLLFGIGATDPATFSLMPLTLLAVAALACWIPSLRATRIDPVRALRNE